MSEYVDMNTNISGDDLLHGVLEMMLSADEDTIDLETMYKLGDREVPVVFKIVLVSVDNQEVSDNG